MSIGRLAYQRGFLGADQVVTVLQAQPDRPLRFGELAIELGLLTPERRDALVALQEAITLPLERVVVELGLASPDGVAEALDAFAARP